MSLSVHNCSFLPLPDEAAFLSVSLLPSTPLLIFFEVVFCFGTKTGKVTRLVTRLPTAVTRLRSLLPTGIECAQEWPINFFWFLRCNTLQMVPFLAFVATNPFATVNTISVNNTIGNVLHFEPHLVPGLHRANEALPSKHLNTPGMLIVI